jgi:hypothetical protein
MNSFLSYWCYELRHTTEGASTAHVNVYNNLYPDTTTEVEVDVEEDLPAGTLVMQVPAPNIVPAAQASNPNPNPNPGQDEHQPIAYTLTSYNGSTTDLPFTVSASGVVTTTEPLSRLRGTKWMFDVVVVPSSSSQCIKGLMCGARV